MKEEEKKFCLKLIKNLLENPSMNFVDTANIRDFFWFKFIEIYEKGDKKEAREWVNFLERIEVIFTAKDNSYLSPNHFHTKSYSGIFLTLAQILSLKFGISKLPFEDVSKESFLKSFEQTKKKLI